MEVSETHIQRDNLRLAARSGDANDLFELARSYDFERPKNKRSAIRWYKKAAALGHPQAQCFLAESYRDGWSVEQSFSKAS